MKSATIWAIELEAALRVPESVIEEATHNPISQFQIEAIQRDARRELLEIIDNLSDPEERKQTTV